MITLPKCGCSERSDDLRVFTCPVCVAAALRWWDGEGVDQHELFTDIDSKGSVSALNETETEPFHISEILRSEGWLPDDLPF